MCLRQEELINNDHVLIGQMAILSNTRDTCKHHNIFIPYRLDAFLKFISTSLNKMNKIIIT